MASLSQQDRTELLNIASESIRCGLENGRPLRVAPDRFGPELREHRATFVTLTEHGELRGCMGNLEAHRTLVEDVSANAYAAGFQDPRFEPLRNRELDQLEIQISILSVPEPMQIESEADLLGQLRPGIDGLILSDGPHRGTFLPSVWQSLPDAGAFLRHLKLKAGLTETYWSPSVRVSRYTSESFSRRAPV